MKIHPKICISHSILPELFGINAYEERFLHYLLLQIAFGVKKILRAVQCTHTSNVPRSPLPQDIYPTHKHYPCQISDL